MDPAVLLDFFLGRLGVVDYSILLSVWEIPEELGDSGEINGILD